MRFTIVTAALLGSTSAYAVDAITYKGTLGRSEIIVELTDPTERMMVGRYSYLRIGGDIPLHNLDGIDSFELVEEAPCTEATCVADEDNTIINSQVGGHWALDFAGDGISLVGHWSQAGEGGKVLDVRLAAIGRRALPAGTELSPKGLADSAFLRIYGHGDPVSAAAQPYEYAKMDVRLTEGAVQDLDGSQIRFVSDPRSVFGFPRVVALADGSSPDATNRALASRHAAINVAAFSCLNSAYAGFAKSPQQISMVGGSLGDYDREIVAVGYLSPTVMGWGEAGSTWCGGAYPDNHFKNFTIDVKTGETLALGLVFKDWTATAVVEKGGFEKTPIDQAAALANPEQYYWAAGQPLIDYALEKYRREPYNDCNLEELMTTNLGLRFGPGDTAIFTLERLPHALSACGDDLLTVKLADIPQLLAPTAKNYFPSLGN